jgi:hypothetical protein
VEKLRPRDGVYHFVLVLFETVSYAVCAGFYAFMLEEKGGLVAYLGYGRNLQFQVCARDPQGEVMMSENLKAARRGVASCRHH